MIDNSEILGKLLTRIEDSKKRGGSDLDSIYLALTKKKSISHYAGFNKEETKLALGKLAEARKYLKKMEGWDRIEDAEKDMASLKEINTIENDVKILNFHNLNLNPRQKIQDGIKILEDFLEVVFSAEGEYASIEKKDRDRIIGLMYEVFSILEQDSEDVDCQEDVEELIDSDAGKKEVNLNDAILKRTNKDVLINLLDYAVSEAEDTLHVINVNNMENGKILDFLNSQVDIYREMIDLMSGK